RRGRIRHRVGAGCTEQRDRQKPEPQRRECRAHLPLHLPTPVSRHRASLWDRRSLVPTSGESSACRQIGWCLPTRLCRRAADLARGASSSSQKDSPPVVVVELVLACTPTKLVGGALPETIAPDFTLTDGPTGQVVPLSALRGS